MSNIVYAAIMPHPPIIINEIGKENIKLAQKTVDACDEVAKRLKNKKPDLIIIFTPHGDVGMAAVHIYNSHVFEGDFRGFGYPKIKMDYKGDTAFAHKIFKASNDRKINCAEIRESSLDHGVLVPMYFMNKEKIKVPILPVAVSFMPLKDLFEFGRALRTAIDKSDKKVAIIASADMSHRLTPDAPAGYDERGSVFDVSLVDLVKKMDVSGILNFDARLAEHAGQDALWSIAMMLGAIDKLNVSHEVISYEGPFGVGYMVAGFDVI